MTWEPRESGLSRQESFTRVGRCVVKWWVKERYKLFNINVRCTSITIALYDISSFSTTTQSRYSIFFSSSKNAIPYTLINSAEIIFQLVIPHFLVHWKCMDNLVNNVYEQYNILSLKITSTNFSLHLYAYGQLRTFKLKFVYWPFLKI